MKSCLDTHELTAKFLYIKALWIIVVGVFLPPLASGQGLPRYRAIELGPGFNLQSITPQGDALTGDDLGARIYNPATGWYRYSFTFIADGLLPNGDSWGFNYQDKAYVHHRAVNTFTEYVPLFGTGLARLTGANNSGQAVGQLDAIAGLGTPTRWLTPTSGEVLREANGATPATYVQAISESGHAIGSVANGDAAIWDPG